MTFSLRNQLLASVALVMLSACGQETIISSTTSSPSPIAGKVAMIDYSTPDIPFSFSYPQGWTVKQINATSVSIASPAMIEEQKLYAGEEIKGDAIPGLPKIEISYYPNIADEPTNKSRQYNAKTLTEYLAKIPSSEILGKTTVDGLPATEVELSQLILSYGVYVSKGTGIYIITFNHKGNEEALSAEERSDLLSLKLLK